MQLKYSNVGEEPLSAAVVKAWLKVDFDTEDALITSLITGVRQKIEEFTGLALVVKTIEYFDEIIEEEFLLPYPEHDAISEVKVNGVISTDYTKTGLNQFIVRPNIVTTTSENDSGFYCKYTTTGNCPEGIKQEMLKLISEKYRKRGNTFNGSTTELNENSYSNLLQFCIC